MARRTNVAVQANVADTRKMALALISFNSEVANVNNMMFMKRGDNYILYAEAVVNGDLSKVTYPVIRAKLVEDLSTVPSKEIKQGDKTVKLYPWGTQAIGMKAHSLAVGIVKTVQKRCLTFNKAGKAVDVELFQKFDKKGNNGKGSIVNKKQTVTEKSVYKKYDEKEAKTFLAKFF